MKPNKSVTGLDANILVLIIYLVCIVLGFIQTPCYIVWIFPITFYFLEKGNQYLQLYMLQGFILFAFNAVITGIFAAIRWGVSLIYFSPLRDMYPIPYGVYALDGVIVTINALVAVVALICIIKAWKYEYYKIPVVYPLAQKLNAFIQDKLNNKQ